MTARTTFNEAVQITSLAGNPKEVLAGYRAELEASNHDIAVSRGTQPTKGTCKRCGVEFRMYWPVIGTGETNIFSDFPHGAQCPKKHMNMFGLMEPII